MIPWFSSWEQGEEALWQISPIWASLNTSRHKQECDTPSSQFDFLPNTRFVHSVQKPTGTRLLHIQLCMWNLSCQLEPWPYLARTVSAHSVVHADTLFLHLFMLSTGLFQRKRFCISGLSLIHSRKPLWTYPKQSFPFHSERQKKKKRWDSASPTLSVRDRLNDSFSPDWSFCEHDLLFRGAKNVEGYKHQGPTPSGWQKPKPSSKHIHPVVD